MSDRRPLSTRQRRVRLTAALIVVALAASAAVLAWRYRGATRNEYRPGEANPDITSALARGLPPEAPKPQLTDVTAAAGLGAFRSFHGRRTSQLPEDMGPGAAWGDYDNDGDEDLFVVGAGGPLGSAPADRAPSVLYENLADGRFRAVAGFPDTRIIGTGAAWGDVDGDGWIDLVVTGYDAILLFRNAQGRFALDPRLASRPGFWTGVAWADFDRDGDLDLYVCGYVQYREEQGDRTRVSRQYGSSVPFTLNPASYAPERNLLFRNGGTGTFTEVGRALGVDNPEGRSLSAVWHDFDGDGWLDLYVANDISDNVLYRNVRGRFDDISHPAWVADHRGAMGLAVGDWNRDGDDDLFVSHWVAQENALYDSLLRDRTRPSAPSTAVAPAAAPPAAKAPPVRFVDAADSVGLGQVALPMVGWGAEFGDFDADGWLDLAVANGSTFETEAAPKELKPQLPFLFWNRRGEYFHDLAPLVPALSTPHVSRGLAVADYDSDGDLDVLIVQRDGGVQLLRNDMQRGHWLKVRLRNRTTGDAGAYGRGLGAQTVASAGGVVLRRAVSPASYLSQSSTVVHFGLGDRTSIDRLDVRWPDGSTTRIEGTLAADRTWEITQGAPTARDVSAPKSRSTAPAAALPPADARSRTLAFWDKQREAMRVLKVEKNVPQAAALLREALVYDPRHEDTRYYLASSLARLGDTDGALAQLEELTRINPSSHRGYSRWGTLRAQTARHAVDLQAAEKALERAHAVNPEETGALLALGEVSLLRADLNRAEDRLTDACTANPRAAGGLFLLGYVRWKRGDGPHAAELLARTRKALGPDWKPHGSTAEGDVEQRAHDETTPLAGLVAGWNGSPKPAEAYAPLDRHLRDRRRP